MGRFLGKAAITWSSTDDTNTKRVHQLSVPLRALKAGHTQSGYSRESLDKSVIETFTVADGAYELVGMIRYEGNPQSLIDLIKAGSENKTLTYIPNLTDPDTQYDVTLISPRSPADLELDAQRESFGDQQVEVRFRLSDEGPFGELFGGTDVLLSYTAGDSLSEWTFTRADTASYVDHEGGGGYGTLSTAASGKARLTWLSTASTQGPRDFPALLLEDARTNLVEDSVNLGSTNWTLASGLTRTSGQADPYGGTNAWLLTDDSTSQFEGLVGAVVFSTNGQHPFSLFLRQGTTSSTSGTVFRIQSSTGAVRGAVTATWSSGIPTQAMSLGASTFAKPERYRGGWWRFTAATSTGLLSTQSNQIHIYPAGVVSVGRKGNVYAFGPQVEK